MVVVVVVINYNLLVTDGICSLLVIKVCLVSLIE